MSFLILYIAEDRAFDKSLIKQFLANCSGVSGLAERAMIGSAISANFDSEGESIIIDLKADLETIVLSGTGKASVWMAFQLQAAYPEALHVVDEGYSFDLVIRDFRNPEDLATAMCREMGQGTG